MEGGSFHATVETRTRNIGLVFKFCEELDSNVGTFESDRMDGTSIGNESKGRVAPRHKDKIFVFVVEGAAVTMAIEAEQNDEATPRLLHLLD